MTTSTAPRDTRTSPPEKQAALLELHCPAERCVERQEPGALTCTAHDRMLIAEGESEHETPRLIMGAALGFALIGVPASVGFANSYPLFALALVFLTALLAVTLKRHPDVQRIVVVGLLVLAPILVYLGAVVPQWLLAVLGVVMVGTSFVSSMRSCRRLGLVGGLSAGIAGIFLASTHAIAASALAITFGPSDPAVERVTSSAIRVAAASMCLPILLAVVQGAVLGRRTPTEQVRPLLNVPDRSRARNIAALQPATSASNMPTRFAERSALLMFRLIARIETTLRGLGRFVIAALVRVINGTVAAAVGFLRRTSTAVRQTWGAQRVALEFVGRATKWSARRVVLPLIFTVAAVELAVLFAEQFHIYLVEGSLLALAATAGLTVSSVLCSLTVAWLVSDRPLREIAKSASCVSSYYAPRLFVLWTLSAWMVGLGGVLRLSPIGVGFLTATATSVLVISLSRYLWQRSRPAR